MAFVVEWQGHEQSIQLWDKEKVKQCQGNGWSKYIYTAHYSMFENYIWHNILVKRYGWPEIPLRQWRCTAAKAATHALPRALANTAIALGLKERKDIEGKRIMLKMCKPRKPTKKELEKAYAKFRQPNTTYADAMFKFKLKNGLRTHPLLWHEDPEDFEKLYKYCINDVEVERAIDNSLPALNKQEQEVWFLDQKINTRGIQVDTEAVDAALFIIEKYTEECNNRLKEITDGYLDKASQVARFKNWMKSKGVILESLTKDSVSKALADGAHPEILEALKIRQQIGKTSVKKFQALKNATCSDGRVRDMFVYHGASTGRWAGKIVQLHNLPRGNLKDPETCIEIMKWKDLEKFKFFYPKVMDAVSSCVRGALIAAPGKDLLVADFAAIEARIVAWLADEKLALKYFRNKEDSYVKMAETIFETDKIDALKRFVGKQSVLGCGFGMGATKFQGTCASLGQEVSESLAKKAVSTFRKNNPNIVKLWHDVERAAIYAVKNGECLNIQGGKIKFFVEGDFLYCQLPSGRRLAYHQPKIERVPYFDKTKDALTFMGVGEQSTYVRQQTWGGTLVENIVQAVARDLLTEAMLRVEKAGYKIILHVHDEIVVEIDEQTALFSTVPGWENFNMLEMKPEQDILKNFINLVIKLPAWAEGCPIDAEGWRGKRYKK